jgi:hypothetical protein
MSVKDRKQCAVRAAETDTRGVARRLAWRDTGRGCREMSLASCLDWAFSRRTAASHPDWRTRAAAVELDRGHCAAGDTVTGNVPGVAEHTAIGLVRLEARPRVYREYIVAEADASSGDGSFELGVPSAALPTATGEQCALLYAVVARSTESPIRPAELRISTTARPHLDTHGSHADRIRSDWDARHFHIELFDAQLQGGGRLAGRVHRHGSWPSGTFQVRACCLECWRCRPSSERGSPQWHESSLWEAAYRLSIDPDAGWTAFCFDIPDDLPPAVEARTIAWRYELVAQRNVRHWVNETAALTPLLHEDAALRASESPRAAGTLVAGTPD